VISRLDYLVRFLPDNYLINKIISTVYFVIYFFHDRIIVFLGRKKIKREIYSDIAPLISVYIPTYNRAEILRTVAIPSVLKQTYKNFELIVADDGSTDNTEKVVRCFNDKRIKYIKVSRSKYRYPNKSIYHWFSGPVIAANKALDKCSGLWIARIDDDDLWTSDHLEKLLKFAIDGKYEFVSSHLLMKSEDGEKKVTCSDDPRDNTKIGATQTWLYKSYLRDLKYNIHSWRKSYFRVNDTDLQYRIYQAGIVVGYLNEVTAIIRPRPGEKHVGSKAYLSDTDKYESFYK
jgi:glycosyltransferase involved in cell wall biosynthesis